MPNRKATLLTLAVVASVATPVPDWATPNHAHLHYMIGVRAYAGSKNAAILYQEASAPELDLRLALLNAQDMERLATEIVPWIERVAATPADEASLIAEEIVTLRIRAASAQKRSAELRQWIEPAAGSGEEEEPGATPVSPELSRKIADRSREIFYDFTMILRQQKSAEKKLGIPIPPDPPVPEGGPVPAK